MPNAAPANLSRRSFLYRRLEKAGAEFETVNDGAVAMRFAGGHREAEYGKNMGLGDLTVLPRIGFKGKGTVEWLTSQGLAIGAESNRAYRQSGGEWALRLAPTEVLIVDSLSGTGGLMGKLHGAWNWAQSAPRPSQGYPMPRQDSHAWFMVTGDMAPEMFAKICGVDMRPAHFPIGRIAQTSVAKMSAILARADLGGTLAYHVLADIASSEYLFGCIEDAMAEFGGGLVGLAALRALGV